MFDRVTEAAEQLATNVSRRAFMGDLGKGALTLAGALGALLAIPSLVQAGVSCACFSGSFCCQYQCPNGTVVLGPQNKCTCKPQYKGCTLVFGGCGCSV
jgi:hypothetical protein